MIYNTDLRLTHGSIIHMYLKKFELKCIEYLCYNNIIPI